VAPDLNGVTMMTTKAKVLGVEIEKAQQIHNDIARPENRLIRLEQIIGHEKKGIPPLIPMSRQGWVKGVKEGRHPQPVYLGNSRTPFYRLIEILDLVHGEYRSDEVA
jgi:hypothetical protein